MSESNQHKQQHQHQELQGQPARVIRRRHPHSTHTVCSVCGKKAFYQFYGTLACDSCRTFFRRCVIRKLDIPCINMDGLCDINPRTRKDCTRCRFQKCMDVGMRSDLVTNPQLVNSQSSSSTLPSMFSLPRNSSLSPPFRRSMSSPPQLLRQSSSNTVAVQCSNVNLSPQYLHYSRPLYSGSIYRVENPSYHNYYYPRMPPFPRHTMVGPQPEPTGYRHYNNLKSFLCESPSVPRPEIPVIETHIQGLTTVEKIKLYEMITVIHSTLLTPDDLTHFIGDTKSDLNTMTCIFISRVIRAFNSLKAAEYLGDHDKKILLKGSVGRIVFLRSIPQFDYQSKCWIVYKYPIARLGEKSRFPMSMIGGLSPTIVQEFDAMVGEMDPSARTDFIFMTIISAICFYDPNQKGLLNPGMVTYEQSLFYSILQKLIISQSRHCSTESAEQDRKSSTISRGIPQTFDEITKEVSGENSSTEEVQCIGGNVSNPAVSRSGTLAKSEIARELEQNIFSRLRVIQTEFENSILEMDPEIQIRLIDRELRSSTAQTIYTVISETTTAD